MSKSDSKALVPESASSSSDDASSEGAPRDLLLVGGRVSDTGGYRVLRQKADRVEVGELRSVAEGKALSGEVVRLHPTEEHQRLFECETLHDSSPATSAGPPQIATDAYRRNWEQIFGMLAEHLDAAEDAPELAPAPRDVSKLN